LSTHPLARYLRAGIKVTINTDDPQVSRVDLAHEYEVVVSALELTEAEIAQTLHHAVEAAFTTDQVKKRLRRALMTTVNDQ
jgi:adenosine deaminase